MTSIDILRGLVIVIMVLDHVRHFFVPGLASSATDFSEISPGMFLTRWVTHICAPTFVFLAGSSVFLQEAARPSKSGLSIFLLTRGLWLIFLELTLVGVAFDFAPSIVFQVFFAIGAGFILLAALIWLPRWAVGGVGLAILFGHNAFDHIRPETFGPLGGLWTLAMERGRLDLIAGRTALVTYPAIPWLGVICLGYASGPVFRLAERLRTRWLTLAAAVCLTLFVGIRGANVYGDPSPWTVQDSDLTTVFSFLNVTKYPPSLQFLLLTLGVMCLGLILAERIRGRLANVLLDFGRTPLLSYVLHLYVAHLLALAIGVAMGLPGEIFFDIRAHPGRQEAAGWGIDLPGVYLGWVATLVLIYPAVHWFAEVKRRSRSWWLSYL